MRDKYLQRIPFLKSSILAVSGNPSFDAILNHKSLLTRRFYSKKYNISPKSKWILYTMMPPGIVNNEIDVVKSICNEIVEQCIDNEVIILLRKNPNHHKNDFKIWTYLKI